MIKFKKNCALMLFLLSSKLLFAQSFESISPNQCQGTLPMADTFQDGEYDSQKYLLTHDIIVETGKTMILAPGTEMLLLKDAAIRIKGNLVCNGTILDPIIFRSLKSTECPNNTHLDNSPWQGIIIHKGGSLVLRNCQISGSLFGISADSANLSVTLDSVLLAQNSIRDLSLGNKPLFVPRDGLIVHGTIKGSDMHFPAEPKSQSKKSQAQADSKKMKPVQIVLGISGLTGCLVGAGGYIAGAIYNKKYTDPKEPNPTEIGKKMDTGALVGNIGLIIGASALAGFGVTFFF